MQVYAPCQKGFVYQTPLTIELGKMVTECGLFPIWEYDPETRKYDYFVPEDRHLVVEYLKLQGRFGHLQSEHIAKIQASANRKWEMIGVDVPAEFREAEDPDYYARHGLAQAGAAATDTAKGW
jgi:pyruvate/2-oxoacid:ferredoxin oxidoreductase beta subunit